MAQHDGNIMKVSLIAAMAKNRTVGKGNDIPWSIPGEQKMFKEITLGHTVIMGRKTYESIGGPLPGRTNVVVTRQRDYSAPGCIVANGLDAAIAKAGEAEDEVFICGGAQVYEQTLPMAQRVYLSTLHRDVEGDAHFPELSPEEFEQVSSEVIDGGEPYTFSVFERK